MITNILIIDDKSYMFEQWVNKLENNLNNSSVSFKIFVVSDRLYNLENKNIEIFNINSFKYIETLESLQSKYDFSLFKILVTDRSITNFSTFDKQYMYSKWDDKKEFMLEKWVSVLDYLIKSKTAHSVIIETEMTKYYTDEDTPHTPGENTTIPIYVNSKINDEFINGVRPNKLTLNIVLWKKLFMKPPIYGFTAWYYWHIRAWARMMF